MQHMFTHVTGKTSYRGFKLITFQKKKKKIISPFSFPKITCFCILPKKS